MYNMDWFRDLFIDEAKPALDRHSTSGGGVTIRNQNKTITENGEYTADSGYTGLGVVTVNVAASGGGDATLEDSLVTRTMTEYTNDRVESIGEYAFYNYKNLKSVSFPNVTHIYTCAFYGCTGLEQVNFPELKSAASANVFRDCKSLTEIILPKYDDNAPSVLGSTSLRLIDLGSARSIAALTFNNCTSLNTLVLREESRIVSLAATSGFQNTPFASGGTGGTVYVPAALITQYQQATNWATLYAAGTCNFVSIEGSEYE